MSKNDVMTRYVAGFVDELTKAGVKNVVISPGSRSTPLAMLMAEHSDIKEWIQVDERSAGFFALGIAKASKEPVALLCTSGTATANYLPAIIEAYYSRVPLLVLTTDRPHELRDIGAPQAIDQIGIFGKFVKWFVEMALPEDSDEMHKYVRRVAGRAVALSLGGPAGPVHLNFPFREPLIPNLSLSDLWDRGNTAIKHSIEVKEGKRQLEQKQIQILAEELKGIENGLIVCGPNDCSSYRNEIMELASILQYPVLADPLSQMRSGSHSKEWIIDSYDGFLRNENLKIQLKPELIIRLGAMPVSKMFLLFLKSHPETRQIIIDGDSGWREPTNMNCEMIFSDEKQFCSLLTANLTKTDRESKWGKKWKQLNIISRDYLEINGIKDCLFEGQIIIELKKLLPDNATLFVGNSMPVRDLDTFFAVNDKNIYIMANRGANGIDGVISSALGASVNKNPLVLLIGDLSFFHDLNGLLLAKLYNLNITIIVVNNDGGGIFSFLPQAKHEKHFEKLFGIPLGLDFEHVVKMYQGSFSRIANWEQFYAKFKKSLVTEGLSVIEVPTERKQNAEIHKNLWESLADLIDDHMNNGGEK